MKYLSILKDSFREAIDGKILYVTVALSCLLFLFLASLSFRPVTMEEEVQNVADQFNFLLKIQTNQVPNLKIHCAIADFQQTNDAVEPWRGDYRFTFVMHVSDPVVAANLSNEMRKMMRQVVPLHFWWLQDLQMKEEASEDSREFRLLVSNHGTRIDNEASWTHEPALFFGALPLPWFRWSLTYTVYWLEDWLVGWVGAAVIVLLSVVVTASFLPNMLRKGTVDLLLSKPITRPVLLLSKYVGGLTFIFLNTAFTIAGVWLILGLRSGIWTYGVLLTILLLTFFFAILYSVSTLVAVLTRSTVVCILLTMVVWAGLWTVGKLHGWIHPLARQAIPQARMTEKAPKEQAPKEPPLKEPAAAAEARSTPPAVPEWLILTVDAVHAVLPRTGDLDQINTRILSQELLSPEERRFRRFAEEGGPSWVESVGVSAAFIVVVLGLSCWFFVLKDY